MMERSEKKPRRENAVVRSRARELLFSGGNYITLVLALALCAPPFVLVYVLSATVAAYTVLWVPYAMLFILAFLVAVPMVLGAVRVAVAIYGKSENPLSEMFFAFSSPWVYLRTLALAVILIAKLTVSVLPALTVKSFVFAALRSVNVMTDLASLLGVIAGVMIFVLLEALLARFQGLLFFAFADGGVEVLKAVDRSWRHCKGRTLQSLKLWLWFVPLVIISALPVCIPLILYTVPYMLCVYVYYMAHAGDGDLPYQYMKLGGEERNENSENEKIIIDNKTVEITETGDTNNE